MLLSFFRRQYQTLATVAAKLERRPYDITQESSLDLYLKELSIFDIEVSNAVRSESNPVSPKASESRDCHKKNRARRSRTSNRCTLPVDKTRLVPEPVFRLKELPPELRMMIYPHELYHLPMATKPALLQALAKDKSLLEDYAQALKLWEFGGMHNFKITSVNVDAFHSMPMKEMLKIKHLTIAVDTASMVFETKDIFHKLKSNKSQLKNNFESIIIDLYQHGSRVWDEIDLVREYFIRYAQNCVAGSSQPYRVIVRQPKDHDRPSPTNVRLYVQGQGRVSWGMAPIVKQTDDNSGVLWIWENGNRML